MTPRGSQRREISKADARAHYAKAATWLETAQESLGAGRWDAAAGCAVIAGINAADAIAGSLLGQRASGEHGEAVKLLEGAGESGRSASRQLAQLLRFKTLAQYDPAPISEADARKAVDLARRLVDRARVTATEPLRIPDK